MSDPLEPTLMPAGEAPSAPPVHHGILLGRFGLRAGWGILLHLVFCVVLTAVLTFAALIVTGNLQKQINRAKQPHAAQQSTTGTTAAEKQDKPMTVKNTVINEGLQFGAVLLATLLMARIESRRFSVYGLGSIRIRDLLPGAFWGLALLSILVGILRALHLLVFDGRLLSGAPLAFYAIKWLLACLFIGLLEEYLIRGYLQFTLTRGLYGLGERIAPSQPRTAAFWIAALITSTIFASLHLLNSGENHLGILMVFIAGIVFSYALWHTGSLWWGIGFHMAWDWAQSYLYGVPDSGGLSAGRLFQTHATGNPLLSGGTDGPEGSLLVIPILLLVFVAVRLSPRGTQPSLEPLDAGSGVPPETAAAIA